MEDSLKKQSPLWRILSTLRDRKKTSGFLLVLIIIAQGANIAVPFVFKILIDALSAFVTAGGGALPVELIVYSALGILVATVLSSVALSSYEYNLFKLATSIEDGLRDRAFRKYLTLQALFHHGSSSGQIIGRIERGGTATYAIINDILGHHLLPPFVVFVCSFLVLLYYNVWIALAVLLPFPIYLIVTRNLSHKIYLIEQEVSEAFEKVSHELYDIAGNVLTVKKFSQEEKEAEHKRILMQRAREIQYSAEKLWGVVETVRAVITTVSRVSVLALSAFFVLDGSATIGEFVLFITLQNMAYQPLAQLSNVFPRMRRNVARLERFFGILDEQVTVLDAPHAQELPPLEDQVEFKDVSFAYRADGEPALRNISVAVPRGMTVALVGRSGSGKTTFINLLLRSYDPQAGQILIDGHSIKDVTQESLRRQIAVVPQEVDLFSRTIADNIAYGQPLTDRELVVKAAKTALAHDFIERLEKGYDTPVGERGVKLSGGERQRIGIARAVLRDPRILILDEATSHLDSESEKLITKATNALVKNRTSFIIAHRLSTVRHADMILVFNNGTIEASGTHAELLKTSATYEKLHSLQFAEE